MTFHCVALHSKAGADQISDEPCLRLATLRFAFARPCSSKQRLRSPYQSIAVACRGFASPLPCVALLCVAVPSLFAARPGRATQCLCASVRCRSFAGPCVSLLLLRRSSPSCACPSPSEAQPCISIASPSKSKRFLRRVSQRISFAALGLAGLLRRRAARRHALLFHRLPEQIKALPLQRPSPQRHRDARPSHANPLPPTSSRCRRISLKASPRCSVAPPRYAAQIHRRTTPLMALPSRIIATLR